MTETLTQLVGRINLPSGETPENGKISFSLADWDKAGIDIFVPGPVSFELTADGDLIDCLLQSTAANDREQVYLPIVTYWSRLSNRLVSVGFPPIGVPSVGPVNFADLLQIPVTVPVAPDVLAQAIAAAVAAQGSAAAAAGSAAAAAGSAGSAASNAGDADTARIAAQLAQAEAEAARDASFVSADLYTTIALGRAAVADGEQFNVLTGIEVIRYTRTSSTTQTELARYPLTALVTGQAAARTFYADTTAFLAATTSGQVGYVGAQQYKNNAGAALAVTRDELGYLRERLNKIVIATSVAGTGAAYTASALDGTWADDVDHLLIFTPHLTNTVGSPTLSVNGGPAYPIGDSGLDALEVGRLTAGYPFILYRTAAGAWRLLTDKWIKQRIFDEETNRALQIAARTFYADTTAFLAATTSGQHGYVGSQQYKNNAGAALAVTRDELGYLRERLGKISTLSSVAGTGAAYTAVGQPDVRAEGSIVYFTPHVDSTATLPTLNTGDGAFNIASATAAPILAGALRAGTPVMLRFTSGAWRMVDLAASNIVALKSVAGTGAAYTATAAEVPLIPGGGTFLSFRPNVTNSGPATLAINGGAALSLVSEGFSPLVANQLVAGADYLSYYRSNLIQIIGVESATRPGPHTQRHISAADEAHRRLSAEALPITSGGTENASIDLNDTTRPWWIASAGDFGRIIRVTSGTCYIDARNAPLGADVPVTVDVSAGATAKIITAALGTSGAIQTVVGSAMVQVYRISTSYYRFVPIAGAVTSDGDTAEDVAACDLHLMTAGQSLAVYWATGAGAYGLQRGFDDLAASNRSVWVTQGATGGSGLLSIDGGAAYWWDHVADGPGPAALTWLDALNAAPANQGMPDAIYWVFGQNLSSFIGTDPELSIAKATEYLQSLFAWMRVQTGEATPIIISMLGSGYYGVTPDRISAARWVEHALIEADANIHYGPEYYDLPRPQDDVHMSHSGQILQGYRLSAYLQNILFGGTIKTGPTVTGLTVLNSNRDYRLKIALGANAITTPSFAQGLAVYAAGETPLTASPLQIQSGYYGVDGANITYTIQLAEAAVGATVYWMHDASTLISGNYIREAKPSGLHNYWPLKAFKSGAF